MRKRGRLKSRFISIVMAAALVVTGSMSSGLSMKVNAAGTAGSGNALKAIGINSDVAPDGFDENDTESNPYGKKTLVGTVSDEVYVAQVGETGSAIIGNNRKAPTGNTYTYTNAASYPEGKYLLSYKNNVTYNVDGQRETTAFISEIALSCERDWEKAKGYIENNGYILFNYNFNEGNKDSPYVFLGYKTSADPRDAITDIIIAMDIKPVDSFTYNGKTYKLTTAKGNESFISEKGDLNCGCSKHNHKLYLYYTKDKDEGEYNTYLVEGFDWRQGEHSETSNSVGGFQGKNSGDTITSFTKDNIIGPFQNINLNDGTAGKVRYLDTRKKTLSIADVEGTVSTNANAAAVQNSIVNKTAGGNFDGNTEGKKSQFAMVSYDSDGLSLSVIDAVNQHASTSTVLTSTIPLSDNANIFYSKASTNGQSYDINTLQAIAYMNVVTGDFDGNGIDEIAVYNPNSGTGSRIEIYALKTAPSKCDIYEMSNWDIKYSIAVTKGNIVSLDAGDANQDGIDDLVVGCDTGVTIYNGSRTSIFSSNDSIDMTFGGNVNDSIIDPSVTIVREKVAGKTNTYLGILAKSASAFSSPQVYGYLNILKYDGVKKKYEVVASKVINLNSVYTSKGSNYNNFYSLRMPLELHYVNHRFMSPYECGDKAVLFSEGTLNIVDAAGHVHYSKREYLSNKIGDLIPYDFQVADLNGTGAETVFYKGYVTYLTNYYDSTGGYVLESGHYLGAASPGSAGPKMPFGFSSASKSGAVYAVLNTDDDTAYMNYTGRHYFDYSDPEVLAVLASPPCFKDLLENDKLSGNYAESTTSYGKTEGSGQSASASATISAGVYTKFEQEVSVLGIANVAQFETELSTTLSFTTEYEQESEVNYSVEYSTSSGVDAVVFYSIPTEIYEYDTTYIDSKTGEKSTYTKRMFFPKQPCVSTIELDKYNSIAENYSELPTIGKGILDHKVGFPDTYPSSSGKYKKVSEFKGNWMTVDYTSAGGGITQSQSIEMSKSHENAFSSGVELSYSVGGGAGGVSVGVTVGSDIEAGYAMTSTSGNSFTATMQNMPKEAEEYGYGMSWKLFAHEGSYTNKNGDTVKFPVVDYLVTDVMTPPSVPEEFHQNYNASTNSSVALEWEYDDPTKAESFNIYRITKIGGKETTILAGVVGTAAGKKNEDTYSYTFIDDGKNDDGSRVILDPGVEYDYYIEATRSLDNPPSRSMPSETISAYTRSDGEYPEIVLKDTSTNKELTSNKLTIFPDRSYGIQVNVKNKNNFQQISYQWQKYDKKKGWTKIKNSNSDTFEIENATADMTGEYRCLVDAIFYNKELQKQSLVSTCTDTISITYKMRSVALESINATSNGKKPEVEVTFKPSNQSCLVTPSGKVRFTIEKGSFQKVYYAQLNDIGNQKATAKLSDAGTITNLEDGNYKVTVYYGGDDVYGSFTSDVQNIVIGNDAIYPVITNVNGKITNTFAYGDVMRIDFYRYSKDSSGKTIEEKLTDETNEGGYSKKLLDVPGEYNGQKIKVKLDGIDGEQTFNYNYTVTKRPIEIGLSHKVLSVNEVSNNLPYPVLLEDSFLADENDKLEDIVEVEFMNAPNGNVITLDDTTPIGTYYAKLKAKDNEKAKCYNMELNSSEIRIGAKLYDVTIEAAQCDGNDAGTVSMINPEGIDGITNKKFGYEQGTKIVLKPKAAKGYVFDHWEVTEDNNTVKVTDTTLNRNLEAKAISFKAVFKPNVFHVTIDESISNGGKVKLPENFVSGMECQVGTELTFIQLEDDNVVPDYWIKKINNKTSYINGAEIKLTVPEADVTLYPVFKGKPCKVEVGDGVIAEYTYVDDQDDTVTERIKNGDTVPKNSVINLRVGNRFAHYMWFINEKEIARNKDASFTLGGDTKIELRPIEVANKPASNITVYTNTIKISDIKLPDNWVWATEDMNKVLVLDKEVTAKAIYSGTDKGSYENETVEIKVLQKKCDHKNTEIKNALDATKDKEGYSGDIYCKDCGEIILKGKVISKLTQPVKVTGVGTISADGKTLTDLDGKKYLVSEKLEKDKLKKNTLIADKKSAGKYKITKVVKKNGKVVSGEVTYMKPYNKNCKLISATGVVKLAGVKFKVTAIAPNCAKGCKKLKTVVIGSYVTNIGKNAFNGCSNLKSITIKGKALKKVGANAFKGINKKAVIKVPKNKKTAYTKLLKGKGQAKTVKIK